MNVYDFDGTIYDGDSTCHFVRWLWRMYPRTLLNLPRTAFCGILYQMKLVSRERYKTTLYQMFRYVDDMELAVSDFVDSHLQKIKAWYLNQQRDDDVVITASPEFLVRRFCQKMGIKYCIGSKVDMKSGTLIGETCRGALKVDRFYFYMYYARKEQGTDPSNYKPPVVSKFYSDRLSDAPMAAIARQAYVVKGDKIEPWPSKKS